MENKYVVTTGANAYSFHDQSTGITICRGEDRELSPRQYRSKKVQIALSSGHLVLVHEDSKVKKYSKDDIEKLLKKLSTQFSNGMEVNKISKAYTLEEAKLMANEYDITAEEDDTVESLIQALLEEFEETKNKK